MRLELHRKYTQTPLDLKTFSPLLLIYWELTSRFSAGSQQVDYIQMMSYMDEDLQFRH